MICDCDKTALFCKVTWNTVPYKEAKGAEMDMWNLQHSSSSIIHCHYKTHTRTQHSVRISSRNWTHNNQTFSAVMVTHKTGFQ